MTCHLCTKSDRLARGWQEDRDEVVQVRPEKLSDGVARVLAVRIAASPQLVLPTEQEISAEFAVSKTVAREVISRLRDVNLVQVHHGRRMQRRPEAEWDYLDPMVLELQDEEGTRKLLLELHDVRMLVEPEVAARAAERRTTAGIETMRAAIAGMRSTEERPDEYLVHDVAFHQAVVAAAGNRVLTHIIDSIGSIMATSRRYTNARPGILPRATGEHEAVLDAIERGDAAAARERMAAHLTGNVGAFVDARVGRG